MVRLLEDAFPPHPAIAANVNDASTRQNRSNPSKTSSTRARALHSGTPESAAKYNLKVLYRRPRKVDIAKKILVAMHRPAEAARAERRRPALRRQIWQRQPSSR
jgi:hypothetical protein